MFARMKRVAPLVVSLVLVVGIGVAGIAVAADSQHKSSALLEGDRLAQTKTLAGLGNQYLQFALKDLYDAGTAAGFSLRPGDPADGARLHAIVNTSSFSNDAAVLTDLAGTPVNAYAQPPGVPPQSDRGYRPLIRSLLAGNPGISSVMKYRGVPLVALAVPVERNGTPRALLIGYFRADRNALQSYNERLHYGRTGVGYMVDSTGTVVASTDPSAVGTAIPSSPALAAMAAGRAGFVDVVRHGAHMTVAYAAVGIGGWGLVVEQPSAEFFGPIRSGTFREDLALLAVLMIAAGLITALNHRRQVALRKAYDYKGELLANTTHELKTPLTAIRGAAMTLGTRWRDMSPGQIDTFLGMIHRRCDGLQKLVDKILTGARLEAGREVPVSLEPVDVSGVLRRIAAEFADASPRHEIAVATHDVWANADPAALDQVLGLLTENAIKYSPDGGQIRLEATRRGDEIVVRVEDHGVGMDAEAREHAFEPYYRASRGNAQRAGGVGLGLSIARHLVQREGGEISVTSVEGAGSVFTFTLAAVEAPSNAPADLPEKVTR